MMTKMKLGFFKRMDSYAEAKEHVDSIRLLSASQVQKLFPDATVKRERIFGLAKSLMAVR
jgi:hypothetical protein